MKIAVIGGNRFVGKYLVEQLIDDKHDVTLFNRSQSGHKKAKLYKFNRDTDKISLRKFDCVVDMCLYTLKQFKLIKKSIPKSVKYIFMSTGAVEYPETFGAYAKQKKLIEEVLSKSQIDYTIIRPSYIDGVDNHLKRIEYFINSIKNKEEIRIEGKTGDYPINIVWVGDVVRVIKKIIENKTKKIKNKIYNVCVDDSITLDELFKEIKKQLDVKNHKIKNSIVTPFPKISLEMDNSLTKKDFRIKFSPVSHIVKLIIKELESEISKSQTVL